MREADDLKSDEGKRLASALHELYQEFNTFLLGDPLPGPRERNGDQAMEAMRNLIEDEYEDEGVVDPIGKIKNNFKHWFTAATKPGG